MDEVIPFSRRLQSLLDGFQPPRTQAWLAEEAGVERSTISRLLRGERNPTLDTLQYLAPVLGITVDDLVRGTDAEEKVQSASQLVRRTDYDAAVKRLAEYEGRLNDSEMRLRSTTDALKQEEERRKKEGLFLYEARLLAERRERDLLELSEQKRHLEEELQRYREALHRAVGQISALQVKLKSMADELKSTAQSSRVAAVLAGIAALTSVVTAASFLGGEEESRESPPKNKKSERKKQ